MFGAPPPLVIGQAAPPFTLAAHDGRLIKLVDFRGKRRVILVLHPDEAALRALEADTKRLAGLHAQVLGLGAQPVETLGRLASRLQLRFPLLGDPSGQVAREYGARWRLPIFSRKTFVIDGRGLLQMAMDGPPDLERVVTFLEGLRGDLPS